jgi:hypothetical protein
MSDKKTYELTGGPEGTGTIQRPAGVKTKSQKLKYDLAIQQRQNPDVKTKLDSLKRQAQDEHAAKIDKPRPSFFPPMEDDTGDAGKDAVEKFFQAADEKYTVGPEDKFYGDVGGELFEKYGLDPKIHGDIDPDKIEDEITQRMEGTGMFEGQKMTQAEAEQDYINFLQESAKKAKARQDFYADPEKVRKAHETTAEFNRLMKAYEADKD